MFRDFGSNANVDFSLSLYYGLFQLIEDKSLLDNHEKLVELIEIEKLHEEVFFENLITLKKKPKNMIFQFELVKVKYLSNINIRKTFISRS